MATTRAKFRVNAVTFNGPVDASTSRLYTLQAVSDSSTPENERFTKYTPYGELRMTIDNPAVQLEVGQYYYLDFTPAEEG